MTWTTHAACAKLRKPGDKLMGKYLIVVNDIQLNVLVEGAGPPLLLLHGFPDSLHLWRHQVPALVNAGYRVIAPDQRGFGRSAAPAGKGHYTAEKISGDAIALLDTFGVREKIGLVGHDWGAVIGWLLATNYPQRIECFTALSSGHPNAFLSAGPEQFLKSWYVLFFQIPGLSERLLRANDWAIYRRFVKGYPESERWIRDISRPGRLTAALNWYRALLPELMGMTFDKVQIPTMGVWSSGDVALSEKQMTNSARWVARMWRYERVDHASHWLMLDRPEELNTLLLDWLAANLTNNL
jgi:pimeloyl-ACP methyl ester carboxylesterase